MNMKLKPFILISAIACIGSFLPFSSAFACLSGIYNCNDKVPLNEPENAVANYTDMPFDVNNESPQGVIIFADDGSNISGRCSGTVKDVVITEDIPDNVILYEASAKLTAPTSTYFPDPGLHYNAFNANIQSHTFSNGKGVIKFDGNVTCIGHSAFYGCTSLTSITIPNSVESIGGFAFASCSGLTSITIPNSVENIDGTAFEGCSGLTSITIPNSVTSIGSSAFDDCSGLASITVEEGNTVYDSREGCNAIIEKSSNTLIAGCKNTIIPNSVTSIGSYAFWGCINLASVSIPNSVTSIGDYAFRDCTGLTSIEIPNSVTSIGDYVFYCCSSLTSVTIPNSVTSIGEYAFQNCTNLSSVTILSPTITIGKRTFDGCNIQ